MLTTSKVQCPISLDSPPTCPQITPCGHIYSFSSIMQHLMNHGGQELRRSAPCPLCYQPIVARELRLVEIRQVQVPAVGDTIDFHLLRRPKTSIIPQPVDPGWGEGWGGLGAAASLGGNGVRGNGMPQGEHGVGVGAASSGTERNSVWQKSKQQVEGKADAVAATPDSTAGFTSPLLINRFSKFATISDAAPLWQVTATELATHAARIITEGGAEAAAEAPPVYMALDALAARARKFAEHRGEVLEQRGLAGGSSSSSSSPQQQGKDAETAVRAVFTAAVHGAQEALGSAAQRAAAANQLAAEFPALHTAPEAGSVSAPGADQPAASYKGPALPSAASGAAGVRGSSPHGSAVDATAEGSISHDRDVHTPVRGGGVPAAALVGNTSAPTPRVDYHEQHDVEDVGGSPRAELHFDHAFSEDEDDSPRYATTSARDAAGGGASSNADGDDMGRHSSSVIPMLRPTHASSQQAGSNAVGAVDTPVGSAHSDKGSVELLGTSPNTYKLNTATADGDFYMYQAADGQWLFLHPVNLRCLLHHYGSYAACPASIKAQLVELEHIVQCESTRRRYKFLSHLPVNGAFWLVEGLLVDPVLSSDNLAPFAEELAQRDRRRRRRAEAAKRESRREAAAAKAAEAARRGPSAEELKAMPQLPAVASSLTGILPDGLDPQQLEEAMTAQAMFESARGSSGAVAVSPPASGVSFARITQMGFAASGPALGSSPPGTGMATPPVAGPNATAGGPVSPLLGAWGAAGTQSAAAKLSGQKQPASKVSSNTNTTAAPNVLAWGDGTATAPAAAATASSSAWGTSKASAGSSQASGITASNAAASGTVAPDQNSGGKWLVLSDGSSAAEPIKDPSQATAAVPVTTAIPSNAGGSNSSSKKGKKGVVLFSTAQRRY